ncbi:Mitochondrial dicarboxylate transporter [Lasiodiplodia hormozganensis]|uniref:Mitochondrial dicarboxylate transporter n=1 Tax=Lasiodiplodia hormozganensis TaxID=869390 RepID=A0AA39Z1Y9_9PEZI|nr:Mitochondrial dicarboxylate carrier [Lasiodiplodia theobromae]KAF4537290.1 Mitochondrial dicarboxylate carrier [Lasiodiplodia theobromae]KAK0661875.1 Mitochondrial dicarboxylate transporter [Lasiodiplodia hormozganensis]
MATTTTTANSAAAAKALETAKSKDIQKAPVRYPFWFGGSASSFAAGVTHPLDLSMPCAAQSPSLAHTLLMFVHVAKTDGVTGLYRGLSASLLRQITYSTTRFGIYEQLKTSMTTPTSTPSMPTLIALSSASGFLGGIVGNPADVLNVRMQHDAALPPANRRNYKNAIDGLIRMTREEGAKSLFRGVWPNSMRAVLMTASQLASYDGFKRMILEYTPLKDGLGTHFAASFAAGFVATTVCSPVDVIKTRVMSAHGESKSLAKLLVDINRIEGFGWMFRGWVPSFIRLGPHTIATFLFLEQHKKIYRKLKGIES